MDVTDESTSLTFNQTRLGLNSLIRLGRISKFHHEGILALFVARRCCRQGGPGH